MAIQAKKDYTMEELEARHNDITVLYDLAEELVSTVESELVAKPNVQLSIVEPLIADVADATDMLAEEFVLLAERRHQKAQMKASKTRIEGALRKVLAAVNDYQARVRDIQKKAHGSIMNIADPVVTKIQRQLEKIIVIFLEFLPISLQSIMSKTEIDQLKARDARVALMMHQMAMGQQG